MLDCRYLEVRAIGELGKEMTDVHGTVGFSWKNGEEDKVSAGIGYKFGF